MKYFEITFVNYDTNNVPCVIARKLYKGKEIPTLITLRELLADEITHQNCEGIMLTDIITDKNIIEEEIFEEIC